MSTPLKLSHNELAALLKSVFRACFGHTQDWAAMAHSVLWLEAHGFGGLDKLMLAMDKEFYVSPFAGDITETETGYAVNFKGGHTMTVVHMMVDLLVEAGRKYGIGTLDIKGAAQTSALIAALTHCARHGFAAQLTGHDYCAHIAAGDDCPALYEGAHDRITLTCAAELSAPEGKCLQSTRQLQSQNHETLMNGLAIDPNIYAALMKVADRTLVEASEASRKGAGE